MMQKALVLLVSFAVTALCLFTPASADRVPFTRGRYGDVWDTLVDPFKILDSIPKDIEAVALTRFDWKETTDAHVFTVDVPGMKKHDIKIEVDDNRVLIISGERRKEKEEEGYKWHRVERSSGKFWRRFRLPENVNVGAIRASLDNGVLTVAVPKISDFKGKDAKVIDGVLTVAVPKTNDFKGKNIDIVENKVTKFGRRNSKIRLSGSIRSNCSQILLEKDARIDIIENKATQFGRIGAISSKIRLTGSIQENCTKTQISNNTLVITTNEPCVVNSISVRVYNSSTT